MKKIENLPKKISVFPLSNFIIFPNTSVPLNIFEPRYIKMIDDSMKANRIIGVVQPRNKNEIPELYSTGCAGRIANFNETDDGRYLIIIRGISRFKILSEIDNLEAIQANADTMKVPLSLLETVKKLKKLPVPNFSAGGIATPADAALMMYLGAEAIFVGSGIFKSDNPVKRADSIVKAVTHYDDSKILASVSEGLKGAMKGLDISEIPSEQMYQERGW